MSRVLSVFFAAAVVGCGAHAVDSSSSKDAASDVTVDSARVVDSAPIDSTHETAVEAAIETGTDAPALPPAMPVLEAPICGTPGCSGGVEESTSCTSSGAWFASLSTKCTEKGKTLIFFEVGNSCAGGGYSAKWICCDAGVATLPVMPSYPACPPRADSWAPGSECNGMRSGVICSYPNPCGAIEEWHCKTGWEPNSSCGCSP
ncbi:MAG: hypothetical protein ACXWUG_15785 [Polyangiales bacterium]